jgi:uncharacterized C2H2 Zn-finger protein
MVPVFENQPVIGDVPVEDRKAELLVEVPRCLYVFDGETDRKSAEFHGQFLR